MTEERVFDEQLAALPQEVVVYHWAQYGVIREEGSQTEGIGQLFLPG